MPRIARCGSAVLRPSRIRTDTAGNPQGISRSFRFFSTLTPGTAMSLSEQIEKEYIQAYKAKDAVRLTVLRLLKTAVKNKLVDLRRPGGSLSDEEMLDVIIKEGKQRQDSIEQYTAANRADLAEKEAAELRILQEYLPKALSPEELAEIIETTVTEPTPKMRCHSDTETRRSRTRYSTISSCLTFSKPRRRNSLSSLSE